MDRGFINGVLFLDLTKTFDTEDHKMLIAKLEVYGVQGHALQRFTSCLSKGKQPFKLTMKYQIMLTLLAESCRGKIVGHYSS